MKKHKLHIVWAVITVVALAVGFYWGKSVGAMDGRGGKSGFGSLAGSGFTGPRTGPPGGGGGGFVAGQVTAIDANSMTLQLPNGNSENVFYSSSTQVIIPQAAPISSVKTGSMVMVGGTQDSSGNFTASTIQVRSTSTGGFGGAGGSRGQTPSPRY